MDTLEIDPIVITVVLVVIFIVCYLAYSGLRYLLKRLFLKPKDSSQRG